MTATIDPPRKVRSFSRRALMTPARQDDLPTSTANADAIPAARVTVSVNLLPDEIVAGRAARSARLVAVLLIAAAVFGTGGWAYHVHGQVGAARAALATAQADNAAALAKQSGFAPLKRTQADIAAAQNRVATATKGSLDWSRLVPAVYAVVPVGVGLTSVAGQVQPVGQTATNSPGTLVISGSSPSKGLVSAFALKLASVRGLVNPFVTNVSTDAKGLVTFSIQVSVTDQAVSARFAKGTR